MILKSACMHRHLAEYPTFNTTLPFELTNGAFDLTDTASCFCFIEHYRLLLLKQLLHRLFIFLLILTRGITLQAQGYSFRHLSITDGLLSDLRLVLTEDRLGRLWMGSAEGINVFDGHQLSSYSLPDNSGLVSSNILSIHCDRQGTIWVYTPLAVQYKKENDSRFRILEPGIAARDGIAFFGDTGEGDLLIVSSTDIYLVNQRMQTSKLSALSYLFKQYQKPLAFEHFQGDEWFIGFREKLVLVNVKQQKPVRELNYRNGWCTARVNDSTILAGSFAKDTIALININSGAITPINHWPVDDGRPIGGYAGTIQSVGGNKYAVACRYQGVYIIDVAQRKALHLVHNPADPASLSSDYTRRLLVARSGTLFVNARGISYTSLSTPQFKAQKYIVDKEGRKYDGAFSSFYQNKQHHLWIGTNSCLALWDRQTGISTYYPFYDPQGGPQKFKTIRTVASDRAGRIWVGTFGVGIGMLKADGTYEQYKATPSLPSRDIHAIINDRHGNFIICTTRGFACFDPIAQRMTTFTDHPKLKGIASQLTYYAMADMQDNWWLAQTEGLYYYNRQEDSLYRITLPGGNVDNAIQALCTDSTGTVYAGGEYGLYIIDPGSLTVQKVLSRKDGLRSDNIVSLLCDKTGSMWILGNIGLSRYDPHTKLLETFDARDGLEQSNHTPCNFYMAPDGEVFIGSAAGFNHFYPRNITSKKDPLKVFITSLELKDTTISAFKTGDLSFEHHQNNLSISYLAVDFKLGPSIQYRYKLADLDSGFVYAGKQRTARYTNLQPGNYSFIVEASINGKNWYPAQQALGFTIHKAFWKTWWFRLLMVLLVVTAVYLFYRKRIKQVNKEARLRSDYEIKLNELENSALRTQMNPHFIFNSLNTINSFVNSNDRAQSNQYISKFSRLVRLILDHSRQKKITLKDELEVAQLYIQLEQIRFDNRFQFNIHVEGADPDITEVPPLIIQPFVENCILHGLLPMEQGGMLKVEIIKESNYLQCIIEDNGIGRTASRQLRERSGYSRRSHGMEITLKRIALFNKEHNLALPINILDLQNGNGEPSGTRIEIPLAYTESF